VVSDGWANAVNTTRGNDGERRRHTLAPTCGTRQHSGPYLVWFNQSSDNRRCVRTTNSSLHAVASKHTHTMEYTWYDSAKQIHYTLHLLQTWLCSKQDIIISHIETMLLLMTRSLTTNNGHKLLNKNVSSQPELMKLGTKTECN